MAGTDIFSVFIGEFRHEIKPCLIILLKLDKNSEIGFHCAILPFDLTVCLWVESGRKSLLYAKEIV